MTCKDCALYESCRHGRGFGNSAEKCYKFTARKFKIGDRVRLIIWQFESLDFIIKFLEEGTVVRYGDYPKSYYVKWKSGIETKTPENYIELIPETKKKTARKPKTRRICHFCIDEETVEDMHCTCGLCHGVTEQVQCPVCKEWFTVGTEFFLDEHGICMQCFDEWTDKHLDELTERAVSEARNDKKRGVQQSHGTNINL